MTTKSLLQTFALNNRGDLVSIEDVPRGLACECACPSCNDPMIARQGDVRAWHFAHASGAECPGGSETALHRAAKAIIERERAFVAPPFQVFETVTGPDGREYTAECAIEVVRWSFTVVGLEQEFEGLRPDVIGHHLPTQNTLLVEVAVTHPVDDAKREALRELGISAVEVHLDPALHEVWTWELLREEVIDGVLNKEWLFCAEEERLRIQALALAREQLQAHIPTIPAQHTPHPKGYLADIRYRIKGALFIVYEWPDTLVLWRKGWIDDELFDAICRLVRTFGGGWRGSKGNWIAPRAMKKWLLGELSCAANEGDLPNVQRAVARMRNG